MDVLNLRVPDLDWLSRRLSGRRARLLRRWLAAGLLTTGLLLLFRPASAPATTAEPITDARPTIAIPGPGDPAMATVPVRLADAAVAELLRPGQRVDVVAAADGDSAPSVLAGHAMVVTVSGPEPQAGRALGPPGKGPLVLLALPSEVATQVAAISLERPVTVTLR